MDPLAEAIAVKRLSAAQQQDSSVPHAGSILTAEAPGSTAAAVASSGAASNGRNNAAAASEASCWQHATASGAAATVFLEQLDRSTSPTMSSVEDTLSHDSLEDEHQEEDVDKLSPLSSPGASAAFAAASANASSRSRSSISIPVPTLPDPDLDPEALGRLLQKASPAISDTRFSMEEFLKNKAQLATAARRELGGGSGQAAAIDDDVGSCLEGSGHEAELARQASHLKATLQGVTEESKVNRELAALLVERLDSSRKALECLLRLLTCLMEAESAYSASMSAAAKAAAAGPLAAPADSGGLAAAVEGLVQLPIAAAAGHRQLYLELQGLVDGVRVLWRKYTAAAKDLRNAIHTAQRNVDGCCKQLQTCFNEHRSACEAFDAAVVWQSTGHQHSSSVSGVTSGVTSAAQQQQHQHRRGFSTSSIEAVGDAWTGAAGMAAAALHLASGSSGGSGGVLRPRFAAAPTRDPWASEGRLAAEQQALQKWQDQERGLLQQGFDSLQDLERERVAALQQAGQSLAASYSSAISGMPAAVAGLQGMIGGLGDAGDAAVQHLSQVAADMRITSQALAERQAEVVSSVSQELFCSPEIIRQGPMELWNPKTSSWSSAHFVLTRAGFLHWFRSMEETTPQDTPLNLCRCSFEAGAAPVFHLVEAGSGGWLVGRGSRQVTLQASSVDECCEWAIALREAIALSSSTGAAAGTSSSSTGSKVASSRLSR